MSSPPRRLKFGLIGLGRIGSIRARILATQQPRIDFVAACDTKPGSDKWAAENLPSSVKFFADPTDLLTNAGIEAVLISTATATHAALIIQVLNLALHVMCEKPVATDVATTEQVLAKAATKPDQVFLIPFTKRYDAFPCADETDDRCRHARHRGRRRNPQRRPAGAQRLLCRYRHPRRRHCAALLAAPGRHYQHQQAGQSRVCRRPAGGLRRAGQDGRCRQRLGPGRVCQRQGVQPARRRPPTPLRCLMPRSGPTLPSSPRLCRTAHP